MTINKLIEFCEEEEYIHRIRCKQYDDASGFTRTGNKDIRTACAFSEEIKRNYYQQIIDTMHKYQKIEKIVEHWACCGYPSESMIAIKEVIEDE